MTRRAVDAGYIDPTTAADWLEFLASPPFFASATLFLTVVEPLVR